MVQERMIDAMSEQRFVGGGDPSAKHRPQIYQQDNIPVRPPSARKAINAESILGADKDSRASGGVVGDADGAESFCSESTDSSLSD